MKAHYKFNRIAKVPIMIKMIMIISKAFSEKAIQIVMLDKMIIIKLEKVVFKAQFIHVR